MLTDEQSGDIRSVERGLFSTSVSRETPPPFVARKNWCHFDDRCLPAGPVHAASLITTALVTQGHGHRLRQMRG
jgi:hypothetical protein